MKKKMIVTSAVIAVAMMSGSAFAAAQLNAGNATIAYEALTAATAYAIPGFNTAYQPSGPVAATTQLKVSTTGSFAAKVDGAASGWNICNGTTKMASTGVGTFAVATTGGETSIVLTLASPLASGTAYTIQDDNCNVAYKSVTSLQVPADPSVGSTISLTVDNALNAGDTNVYATAVATTVKKQFTATLYPVTSTIDFATASKKFKAVAAVAPATAPVTTATTSTAGYLLTSDQTIGTPVTTSITNTTCGTFPADIVKVKVAGTFTEVVNATPVATTVKAAGVNADAVVKTTDASATVSVPAGTGANKVCGASTAAATAAAAISLIDITTDGTTNVLVPRTFTTTVSFKGGAAIGAIPLANSAANLGTLVSGTSHTFKQDTTSYVAPFVKYSPDATQQSYFKLTYKGVNASTAALKVNVVATDGQLKVLDFGTLAAGQTRQVTGGDIVAAAIAGGYTLGQVNGVYNFPATFEIQATEADTYAYGVAAAGTFFTRIPMKVSGANIVE